LPPIRTNRGFQKPDQGDKKFTRVNFYIRVPQVRVVKDGEQLGVMPTEQARNMALDAGLDLVEIVPDARPPVCHILDWAKKKYEDGIRDKEARKKQKQSEQKEIKLRPGIQDNDIETKAKHARRFLEDGKAVQFTLQYRRRELHHKEVGHAVMTKILQCLEEVGTPERTPRMEGDRLCCRLLPKKTGGRDGKPVGQAEGKTP
jgi:translation initiation factor IF-3